MQILIVYGTTEGQTAKVCRFAMERLTKAGHSVALMPAAAAEGVEPAAYDAVIVAASVHAGRYQSDLVDYVATHSAALNRIKTLFLSVSLAAAEDDPDDMRELGEIVERLKSKTGWTPGRVEHVAGAFKFSEYDFFKYWAMRWIESRKETTGTPGEDHEYTDWEALEAVLTGWAS